MTFYFLILFGLYFVLLVVLRIGWSKAVGLKQGEPERNKLLISVIIPVRNEGQHMNTLIGSLAAQTYPSNNFEVIIVDDHSSDKGVENHGELISNVSVRFLGENEHGKKAALTCGISFAKGDIIATTDADCVLPPDWLEAINSVFQNQRVAMAAGLVTTADDDKFFSRWQAMEFASVIGTGVGAFGLNRPLMCNGANLSFRKGTFQEVRGYEGNEHFPSGDDEFLMRKIVERFPGSIQMVNSVVVTLPQESLKDFLHQRIRWASKWRGNPSWIAKLLAVFIFLVQASWIFLFLSATWLDFSTTLVLMAVKIAADLLFLTPIFKYMKIKFRLLPFLGLQFLYPFYVIFIGLLAPWSSYRWKDRKIL